MSEPFDCDVLIIGGGCAGLTAGLYASRARLKTILLDKLAPGGQLSTTHEVENYPGFPEVVEGPELMDRFTAQAVRFGCDIRTGGAASISADEPVARVAHTDNGDIRARAIIVCSGADPKTLGVPGEDRLRGRGVSYCATCDAPFFRNRDVAVVGGGNTALDEGLYISQFASSVTIVHRRDELRGEKIYQERAFKNEKIAFQWDSVVEECVGDDVLGKIVLRNVKTDARSELAVAGCFILIGTRPNTDFLAGLCELDDIGFVKINERMETSVQGIFAAGDVEDALWRQAVTAAGAGCAAALSARHYLDGLGGSAAGK